MGYVFNISNRTVSVLWCLLIIYLIEIYLSIFWCILSIYSIYSIEMLHHTQFLTHIYSLYSLECALYCPRLSSRPM